MYSQALMDHAVHPRNRGRLPEPSATGTSYFHRCGDRMTIDFRVADGRVEEVRAEAYGCGASVAAASAATELLRGRPVEEARNLSSFTLNDALGDVPAPKRHALWMVLECVAQALGPRDRDIPNGGTHA
ncbi:MAG: iron-sulfur cluster assembly scaffold protein [Candidatus Methylomirabilis sp.]|nr:iron-sulfur cluster assembly scaffold protein [Deltaproteobacteria bacterium]